MRDKDKIILKLIYDHYKKNSSVKIIDIGAGGRIFESKLPKNTEYHTLDIDPKCNPDILCDLNKRLPIKKEEYDFIICTEVLEHTLYPRKIIQELKRILKKEGLIILSLPNEYNLYLRIKFFLGIPNNTEIPFREDLWKNHIQKAKISDLIRFYRESFQIKTLTYSWDSFSDKKFNFIIDIIIRTFLLPLSKDLFARSVIVVGGKSEKR